MSSMLSSSQLLLQALTSGPNADRWLTAHEDPLAAIYTFSSCLALSDLTGDGDFKLVVADLGSGNYNMKLRVYKGTQMVSENTIIDLPTGVVTFHMDQSDPRVPAIAVASGAHIYVYKNLRPYFKFTLPTLDIHHKEKELWSKSDLDLGSLCEGLQTLRTELGDNRLTARTQRLLMINDRQEAQGFVDSHRGFPLHRQTVVTCISTLKKSHNEESSVSCLVLGTEASSIYILDPEAFTIMESMGLPSPPAHLSVTGLYDVDFRIVAACRNGTLCTLKRGWATAKTIAVLDSQAVGLVRRDKTVTVATMSDRLSCFSSKGRKLWQLSLPAAVLCMEPMDIESRGLQLTAVATSDEKVLIFADRHIVDCFTLSDSVSAMKFGKFGREDSALVLVTVGGAIIVKILKRTAQFEKMEARGLGHALAAAKNQKLAIPKKTRLFVDQTMRERENSLLMHRAFQHDLYLLRLNTARAFVGAMESGSNPVSTDADEPLKLSAQVLGLGPVFRLLIGLCNTSSGKPSRNLMITFYCDDKLYSLSRNMIRVPMLVPGLEYVFETLVECISDLGISDQIRVFVVRPGNNNNNNNTKPLLSAIINMPVAELV